MTSTDTGRIPVQTETLEPSDQLAERAVLSAALNRPDLIPELAGILRDDDFHNLAHEAIWQALTDQHATGAPCDLVTIERLTHANKSLLDAGGGVYLFGLYELQDAPSAAVFHAREISRQGRARRSLALARRLAQNAMGDYDPGLEADWIEARLHERNPAGAAGRSIPDVDEFLAQDEDGSYDWIIPGLLERQDRVILTGPEGKGKSTLLRQIAVMCAAGLHPFTGTEQPPVRVLLIDLENSERQARRKLRPLRIQAGPRLDPDLLRVQIRSAGINLLEADDRAWLAETCRVVRPDLVLTGPIYKLAAGDPNKEEIAKATSRALDTVREQGAAIILEAHTGHEQEGRRSRPKRPIGASLWLRWPEFGIWLDDDGRLEHWRGARDEREWPFALQRGGAWPWTPIDDENEHRWRAIKTAREAAAEPLSQRQLQVATGLSKGMIGRVLAAHRFDWTIINGSLEEDENGE